MPWFLTAASDLADGHGWGCWLDPRPPPCGRLTPKRMETRLGEKAAPRTPCFVTGTRKRCVGLDSPASRFVGAMAPGVHGLSLLSPGSPCRAQPFSSSAPSPGRDRKGGGASSGNTFDDENPAHRCTLSPRGQGHGADSAPLFGLRTQVNNSGVSPLLQRVWRR